MTRADDGQLFERKLTAAGVQLVRGELVGTGLFERDQRFDLELLPGANPPGRGIGGLSFKMWRDTRTVEVHTVMHMGADEVYFVPSAARTRLDQLWKQLVRPETWLPANAWADSTPRPYQAAAFALLLRTEIGQANERAMIDAIQSTWPFSVGAFDLGQTMPETAGPLADTTRCSVLTRDDMVAVTNAIVGASGGESPDVSPDGTVVTSFAAANNQARLVVIMRPLLPDRGSCSGESSW